MDFTLLAEGFQIFLRFFWVIPIGVFAGMLIGATPGLAASNSLAILLPLMLVMPPDMGLIVIIAIYSGAEIGNSYPAVILNLPGNASSAVTAMEGYPFTERGKASYALGICIMSSTIGGVIASTLSLLLTPLIATFALKISAIEMTIIIISGLVIIAQLSAGGLIKGMLAGFLGLLVSTIGTDPQFGQRRTTFDSVYLMDGLPVIAVLIGTLAFSELLKIANREIDGTRIKGNINTGFKEILSGMKDTVKHPIELLRSSLIGHFIGILPGAGTSVASFVAYQQSYNFASSEQKKMFSKGSTNGLIAADSSNNAMIGGGVIPLLTLGIPGSATLAIALVVMGYHGLNVGPMLFQTDGAIAYAMLWSLLGAALVILVMGTLVAFIAFQILRVPLETILVVVSVLTLIGAFASRENVFDMWILVFFGVLGFIMKKYNYPAIGFIIGFILGGSFEANLFRGLSMGLGSPIIFFTQPIAIVLWILLFLTVAVSTILKQFRKNR